MKNNLEKIRKERKISQEELAIEIGVSRQTIGSLEKGRYDPSIVLAFKLARYFGMNIEDIFIYGDNVRLKRRKSMEYYNYAVLEEKTIIEDLSNPILNYGIGIWAESEKADHLSKKEKKYMLTFNIDGEKKEFETEQKLFQLLKTGDKGKVTCKNGKITAFDPQ